MDLAHRLAAEGAAEGTLVWAGRQEQGRGRLGRVWISPPGGAYFSLILRPSRPLAEISQLALVVGLAVAEAIRQVTNLVPSIRWPNDVLIEGKKVVGILVESRTQFADAPPSVPRSLPSIVVGIGINVTTDPRDLPDTAASLTTLNSNLEPRTSKLSYELTGAVCRHLQSWYDAWTVQGFVPIRDALRSWIGMFGQPVRLSAGSEQVEGTVADLDGAGRLLVRLDAGLIRAFDMAEVTLLR